MSGQGLGRLGVWKMVGVAMAAFGFAFSLVPLYRGEKTFEEIAAYLKAAGYDAHYIIPGYFSKKLNRQLQVDGVFFRA